MLQSRQSTSEGTAVRRRILVVDDDTLQLHAVQRAVRDDARIALAVADNAVDAMVHIAKCKPDLVIMDILMPDQDGFESISMIRHESPKVKIIAMTGSNDMIGVLDFLDVAKMLGAHRTIQKPFDMKDLLDAAQTPSAQLPSPLFRCLSITARTPS